MRPTASLGRTGRARTKPDWREVYAQAVVLALAMIVVAVWVYTKPIVFSQDTLTYIHHARELQLRTTLPGALFSRTPGLPLVLLLFHVTDLKHSVFWLIVFHSVLAVATCWLFYLTARLIDRGSALIISLVFIATMLPFMNVKYIMTEQMFLFATMLSAYGLVSYLMARTTRDAKRAIIELGLAVAVMTLTRPQGAFLLLVLFGLAAVLVWRRAWIALTAAVAVYAAVWCIQAVDQRIRSDAYSFAGSLDNSRLGGKALLFAVYLDGSRANIRLLQTVSQQFWRQK